MKTVCKGRIAPERAGEIRLQISRTEQLTNPTRETVTEYLLEENVLIMWLTDSTTGSILVATYYIVDESGTCRRFCVSSEETLNYYKQLMMEYQYLMENNNTIHSILALESWCDSWIRISQAINEICDIGKIAADYNKSKRQKLKMAIVLYRR